MIGSRRGFASVLRHIPGNTPGNWLNDLIVRTGVLGSSALPTYWYRNTPNFGDMLGRAILDHVLGDLGQPVWVSGRFKGKILALGSILDRVQTGDVIWGTGSIDGTAISGRQATFLAVRGPLTRDAIEGDVPEIYGDPAMILPDIYSPESIEQAGVGVVPHYVDRKSMHVSDSMVRMIDVFDPWKTVVDQIVNCDVVISSSLHGIIVAETYGVPAVWVVASDRVVGAGFKFRDYYRATGRVVEKPEPWRRSLGSMVSAAEPPPRIKTSEFRAAGAGLVDLQENSHFA